MKERLRLIFTGNKITDCNSNAQPLIHLNGVQATFLSSNKFTQQQQGWHFLQYEDLVRAAHSFTTNKIISSGKIITNKFVEEKNNITQ